MSERHPDKSSPEKRTVQIVEEVPGVPEGEKYFIHLDGKTLHFPAAGTAIRWCIRHGYNYTVEPFLP